MTDKTAEEPEEPVASTEELDTENLSTFYIGFRRKSDHSKTRIIKLDTELDFNYNQFAYLVKQEIPDALPILVRIK